MNPKLLIAFLAVVGLSGCIVYGGGGSRPPAPGDVTFTWSFSGGSCADYPQIKSVVVNIPGESLQNGGVFPCLANNYPGIVLHDFRAGPYDYTIEAVGYGDELLFSGGGSFSVNGDTRVTIDLTPVGGPNSYAYLTWRFPPYGGYSNPSCQVVGITTVEVSIDGEPADRYACTAGFAQPGVTTRYLAAGQHTIEMLGVTANGAAPYRVSGTFQTFGGAPVSSDHLFWAIGGAVVSWRFTDGSIAQSCGSAGIGKVYVNFQDSSGAWVYGTAGDPQDCAQAAVAYDYLRPGSYRVLMQAYGAGNVLYSSNQAAPPVVSVSAGVFPSLSSPLVLQLFRQ